MLCLHLFSINRVSLVESSLIGWVHISWILPFLFLTLVRRLSLTETETKTEWFKTLMRRLSLTESPLRPSRSMCLCSQCFGVPGSSAQHLNWDLPSTRTRGLNAEPRPGFPPPTAFTFSWGRGRKEGPYQHELKRLYASPSPGSGILVPSEKITGNGAFGRWWSHENGTLVMKLMPQFITSGEGQMSICSGWVWITNQRLDSIPVKLNESANVSGLLSGARGTRR